MNEADGEDCGLDDISERPRKRLRQRHRDGAKHVNSRNTRALVGQARVVVAEPQARSQAVEVGRGLAAPIKAGKGCDCEQHLESFRPRFETARRSRLELKSMSSTTSSEFNCARPIPIAIEVFFDANGNWVYHSQCIRTFFGFSTNWSAAIHAAAVALFMSPTVKIIKRLLGNNVDSVMRRLVVPEWCTLSPLKYLKSLDNHAEVTLNAERQSFHGLVGQPSNNSKTKSRQFVISFVRGNSAPNGRTPDKHGRCYGARLYLDARFLVYKKKDEADTRLAFSTAVVRAMSSIEPFLSNPKMRVTPRTAYQMFREEFGRRRVVNGVSEHNNNFTTIYPHKSDACADCVRYREQVRSDRQTLKRHQQQMDRTLPRKN